MNQRLNTRTENSSEVGVQLARITRDTDNRKANFHAKIRGTVTTIDIANR
uniref:Uncharacterized protein n=1 Tax=Arion vulgaris TaxID=1028688 RepID=A0A0B7B4J3_9EUPU